MQVVKTPIIVISLVVAALSLNFQITKAHSLTFSQAVKQGLEQNQELIEQRKEIEEEKRELVEIKTEVDWQWAAEVRPRLVSEGTRISARRDLVSLAGERTFWPGLTLEPKLYVKEKEVRNKGWQQAEVYFNLEAEQPLYPFAASKPKQDYQETELDLKIAQAELRELKRDKLVDWLEAYLELIELNQEMELKRAEHELAQQELKQVKEKYQTGETDKEELVEIKIDVNEAAQDVKEVKNDYEAQLSELRWELAVGEKEKIKVPPGENFLLRWEQKLTSRLPDLSDIEQLVKAAKANSSKLEVLQWERRQLERELKQQQAEEKPELTMEAEYDTDNQDWKVGINFSRDLFTRQEEKLARKELKEEQAEIERKIDSYLQELSTELKSLVKAIRVTKLKVREQKLRLEEATLELTKISRQSAPQDCREQQLDRKAAKLKLQEIRHQLLLEKYEAAQLIVSDLKKLKVGK